MPKGNFYIKFWDNFHVFPGADEDDMYDIEDGFETYEEAEARAKRSVGGQICNNLDKTKEVFIDVFKTMGTDPMIFSSETNKPIGTFNSIDYIEKTFDEYKNSERE